LRQAIGTLRKAFKVIDVCCSTGLPQQGRASSVAALLSRCLLLCAAVACLCALPAAAAEIAASPARANFGQETASAEAQELAHWVVHSADNRNLPFLIVDKVQAKVFVFDRTGQLRGASAALLGLAIGDDSVPGIGQRKLSTIRPEERTTPAGRFVASLARDLHGEEVLWVDYDTAVSLHRVIKGNPKDRRAERLASPTPLDNRISYGCINVPVKFYDDVVSPSFRGTAGIAYVLPETRSARQVFGSYAVEDAAVAVSPAQPQVLEAPVTAKGN
jgi:hypothetical protein